MNLELQQGSCSHDREQASTQLNPVRGTVYQLSYSLGHAIKSRNESSCHICEVLESCLGVRGFGCSNTVLSSFHKTRVYEFSEANFWSSSMSWTWRREADTGQRCIKSHTLTSLPQKWTMWCHVHTAAGHLAAKRWVWLWDSGCPKDRCTHMLSARHIRHVHLS